MAIWLELNSSKWNLPQISGCTVSYGTGWSNASTRFNRSARRPILPPAYPFPPDHRQAEQSDSDPGQLAEPPEHRQDDTSHGYALACFRKNAARADFSVFPWATASTIVTRV